MRRARLFFPVPGIWSKFYRVSKLLYYFNCAAKSLTRSGRRCPSCGSPVSAPVDRKWLITSLRRCASCRLLFRAPSFSPGENDRFYQERYSSNSTTELPGESELRELLSAGFRGHPKNCSAYFGVLEALGALPGGRLLDFGCSWGYGSWQLRAAGYRVEAYEISARRAAYAREKLRIPVLPEPVFLPGNYDIFFSSHVIEHVPSVAGMIETGLRALRPGGLFIAFTPNPSLEQPRADGADFRRMWGYAHPQLIDREFIEALPCPSLIALSSPYDLDCLRDWDGRSRLIEPMAGPEILLAIRSPRVDTNASGIN